MYDAKLAMLQESLDLVHVKLSQLEELLRPNAPVAEKEYLTVAEASEAFNISVRSLYRLKHLQCRRGRSVRFKRQALENHLRPRAYLRKAS